MKIVENTTPYPARPLRSLILRVFRQEEVPRDVVGRVEVIVNARKHIAYTGRATYSGRRMWLRIPRRDADPVRVAWIIAHEAQHLKGVHHRDYYTKFLRDWPPAEWLEANFGWARAFPLAPAPRPQVDLDKQRAELVAARQKHAEQMLQRAVTRARRAETIRRRWLKTVNRYKRLEAQAAKQKEGGSDGSDAV